MKNAYNTSAYGSFAYVYDIFMDNVDYQTWGKWLKQQHAAQGITDGLVLDLGCGTGALTAQVLEQDPRRQVTGLDLSEQMLAQARARLGDRVNLVQGDSEHLPFPDQSFDVVYCCDSFHHYPDPAAVLAEVGRVLVPGGVFLLGDIWLPLPGRLLMNPFLRWSREGDVKIYSRREIKTLMGLEFRQVTWRRAGSRAFVARGVR